MDIKYLLPENGHSSRYSPKNTFNGWLNPIFITLFLVLIWSGHKLPKDLQLGNWICSVNVVILQLKYDLFKSNKSGAAQKAKGLIRLNVYFTINFKALIFYSRSWWINKECTLTNLANPFDENGKTFTLRLTLVHYTTFQIN